MSVANNVIYLLRKSLLQPQKEDKLSVLSHQDAERLSDLQGDAINFFGAGLPKIKVLQS